MKNPFKYLILLLFIYASAVWAGQGCDNQPVSPEAFKKGMSLAVKLRAALEASGQQTVILARAGQDLSKQGLRWSHAGMAYRENGAWTVLHKLNDCGTDHATLFKQGLANFFMDSPYEYRVLILTLKPEVSARLLAQVPYAKSVDQPAYSLLAYPFSMEYQNSNGWLLEFSALAISDQATAGRALAQGFLRDTHYKGSTIEVSAADRIGGSLFKANVHFTDHPLSKRLKGNYEAVTVESIQSWLQKNGWLAASQELRL
jgi:hypothetical protein